MDWDWCKNCKYCKYISGVNLDGGTHSKDNINSATGEYIDIIMDAAHATRVLSSL